MQGEDKIKNKSTSTDSCCSGMEMENSLKLLFQLLKYFPWDSNCSGPAHKIKIDNLKVHI